jgi:hypothetical protein
MPSPTIIAGKYEILGKLGQGGQGSVYKVRHLGLDEIRALKLQPDQGTDSAETVVRFRREGRALARLRHPHIVQVFDLGRDGEQYYLEMEYIEGPNLAQYLKIRGRPPVLEALDIACQVASALTYAHSQPYLDSAGAQHRGMVHRDIKPSNILLRDQMPINAFVADFGLVKLGDAGERTTTGTMLGTYRYSAPEQLGLKRGRERVPVDFRADIFAFGLVLYELLEGRMFHAGLEPQEILARVLFEPGALVPEFTGSISSGLRDLVTRMVARFPDERPESMASVLRELELHVADLMGQDAETIVPSGREVGRAIDAASDADLEARIRALTEERGRRQARTAQDSAAAARRRALESGADELAAASFEAANRLQQEASALLRSGSARDARSLYEEAAKLFAASAMAAAAARAKHDAEQARTDAQAGRRSAEEARAHDLAPDEFTSARAQETEAESVLESGDHAGASRAFAAAQSTYATARATALIAAARNEAAAARAAAERAREAAVAAGGDRHAAATWQAAEAAFTDAERLERDGQYAEAAGAFEGASGRFEAASRESAATQASNADKAAQRLFETARAAGADDAALDRARAAFESAQHAFRRCDVASALREVAAGSALVEAATVEAHRRREEEREREEELQRQREEAARLETEARAARARAEGARNVAIAAQAETHARKPMEIATRAFESAERHAESGRAVEAAAAFDQAQERFAEATLEATRVREELRRHEAEAEARRVAEAARRERERREAEQKEAERREAERKETERREAERREAERKEAERREAERREVERREAERRELERRETERKEAQRREAARHEAARQEAARRKAERLAAEDVHDARAEYGEDDTTIVVPETVKFEPPEGEDQTVAVRPPPAEAPEIDRESTIIAPIPDVTTPPADPEPSAPVSPVAPEPPSPRPRGRIWQLAVAAAVLAAVGIGGWSLFHTSVGNRPATEAPPSPPAPPPIHPVEPPPPPPAPTWAAVSPPPGQELAVNEGESLRFSVAVQRSEAQPDLSYLWSIDGQERGHRPSFEYLPDFDQGGRTHTIEATASSSSGRVTQSWEVKVVDVDRPPVIQSAEPSTESVGLQAGQEQRFTVSASDPDQSTGDTLTYEWERDGRRVGSGREASFTLRDAKPGTTHVSVTVRDSQGKAPPPQTWTVAVAAPPTPPPAPLGPPHITAQAPKPGKVIGVQEGGSVDFSVQVEQASKDERVTTVWFLDGKEVSRGPRWHFKAPEVKKDRTPVTVEAEVSNQAGTAPRVTWNLAVAWAPPELSQVQPRGRSLSLFVGDSRELSVRASSPAGKTLAYEWTVDHEPAKGNGRDAYTFTAEAPGSHAVEVAAIDARGPRTTYQWTIDVKPEPPPTPVTVPTTIPPAPIRPPTPIPTTLPQREASVTGGAISRAEAEGWIDRLRSAWERKDFNALREMGEIPPGQEQAFAKAVGAYKEYHVDIKVASVVVDSTGAQVTFDRTDSDETGRKLPYPRKTVHLERGPGGGLVVSR